MKTVEVLFENSLNKGLITDDVSKIFGRAIRESVQKNGLEITNEYVGLRKEGNKMYLGIYTQNHESIKKLLPLKEMFYNFYKKSDYTIKNSAEVFQRRVGHILFKMYEVGRLKKENGKLVTLEQGLKILENKLYKDISNWQISVDNSTLDGIDFEDRVKYRKNINRLVANQWINDSDYKLKLGKSIVLMKLDGDKYIIGNGEK